MKQPTRARIRTPGLRPRCAAIHPVTRATCLKPEHHPQNHEWSKKVYTKHTTRTRPEPAPKKKKFISAEARRAVLSMVEDEQYRARLLADFRARKIRPAVEVMIWAYAKGRPVESVEHSGTLQLDDEFSALTDEELRDRALRLVAKLKGGIH
jgi:hypothetical protein